MAGKHTHTHNQRKEKKETLFSSIGSLPKCLQQSAKARSPELQAMKLAGTKAHEGKLDRKCEIDET